MINNLYLIGGAVVLVGVLFYGNSQFDKGYQRAIDEKNREMIKVIQEKNKEQKIIAEKLKEVQNARKNNKVWSNTELPSDMLRLLQGQK